MPTEGIPVSLGRGGCQKPSSLPIENGEVALTTAHSGDLSKVKIFIPPGTTGFSV